MSSTDLLNNHVRKPLSINLVPPCPTPQITTFNSAINSIHHNLPSILDLMKVKIKLKPLIVWPKSICHIHLRVLCKMCPLFVLTLSSVFLINYLCSPFNLKAQTVESWKSPKNVSSHVILLQSDKLSVKDVVRSIRENSQIISTLKENFSESSESMKTLNNDDQRVESSVISQQQNKKSINSMSEWVENGVFWSKQIESLTPKGFSIEDDLKWIQSINASDVVEVSIGCGRMQNRLLKLSDNRRICVRYRKNNDQIQGEFFSFLLARILNIGNVPSSTMLVFQQHNQSGLKWKKVKHKLREAQWETKPIVLTKHVDDLKPAFIPNAFRTSRRRLYPLRQNISSLNTSQLIELVQWSDLIVFDYLTANIDRVINNIINQRWNPEMMNSAAHNLLQTKSNLLLFLDNESGLFHGYRLLAKYEPIHKSLLEKLCIFRQSTIDNLEKLDQLDVKSMMELFSKHFRMHVLNYETRIQRTHLHLLPKNNIAILKKRIHQVIKQVHYCQKQFPNAK